MVSFSKLASLCAAAPLATSALLIKKQIPGYGDGDASKVDNTITRNAMFDCADGTGAEIGAIGKSDNMETRVLAAKAAAIAGMDTSEASTDSMDSYGANTKGVQDFQRHAAQDCEDGGEKKKDMDEEAPFAERTNFSGPGSPEAEAHATIDEALDRARLIKKEYMGMYGQR